MKSDCCILMVEIENGENLRKFSMERIQIPMCQYLELCVQCMWQLTIGIWQKTWVPGQ